MTIIKKISNNKFIGISFLWFGAAISIAEITTGTMAAPLGVTIGILAIFTGHILGCLLLFGMALIGAKSSQSAMNTTKIGFGSTGGKLFGFLNIIQLVGWASVMIYQGGILFDMNRTHIFYVIVIMISIGIIVWVLVTNKSSHLLNTIVVSTMLIVVIFITFYIFFSGHYLEIQNTDGLSFGTVVELSAVMPISWLPVIADYTSKISTNPVKSSSLAAGAYFLAGCWMYILGLGSALFIGASDPNTAISVIFHALPFFIIPVFIGIFSTIVGTYFDANSSGESFASLFKSKKMQSKTTLVAVIVVIVAASIAVLASSDFISVYEQFLYLIGAVFAPMASVLIVNSLFFKRDFSKNKFDFVNLAIWFIGFAVYEICSNFQVETTIGLSLPVAILTALLSFIACLVRRK